MSLETFLDELHGKVRKIRILHYFAFFNRVVLAVSFIPSGLTKLAGNRFTLLGTDTAVGAFFESFYQTGGWYRFVGLAQIVAAILLLIPRTSTLGAALFFPIVLNIVVITIAVGFKGTWVITSMMLLANTFLICWDYDKFKRLLPFERTSDTQPRLRANLPLTILGAVGGVIIGLFFTAINPTFKTLGIVTPVLGCVLGGLVGYLNSRALQ
jgi:uncharacterized membrane protein YphA (DoxX/SURF4 family)